MNGLIALYKGTVYLQTNGSYSYYVTNNPNWYVCNGSQINDNFTTPNLVGYIPVGATDTNIVNTSGGTISISENIPIQNHSHSIDLSGSSNIINNITVNELDGTINEYAIDTASLEFYKSSTTNHTHSTSSNTGITNINVSFSLNETSTTSSKINYVSQYFIIYYSSLLYSIPLFKGMIYNWNGNIILNGSYYQPCDSSNNVYSNWYVCCNTNNSINSNIPSFDDRIAVILTSGSSSINNGTSIRETINIGSHTHDTSTPLIESSISTTFNNTQYNTFNNVVLNDYVVGITCSYVTSTLPINSISNNHTHTLNYTYSNLDTQINTTETYSDPIFKYINLYYIIYLPNLS
jgi:hypothetical protein